MHRLLGRQLLTVLLFLGLSVPAQSAVVNSPGAIASIEAPPGLTFAYPAEMDLLQFVEEGRTQILVSVLRPGEPKALLALLLQSLELTMARSPVTRNHPSRWERKASSYMGGIPLLAGQARAYWAVVARPKAPGR